MYCGKMYMYNCHLFPNGGLMLISNSNQLKSMKKEVVIFDCYQFPILINNDSTSVDCYWKLFLSFYKKKYSAKFFCNGLSHFIIVSISW